MEKKYKVRLSIKRVDVQVSIVCFILVAVSCFAVYFANYSATYENTVETLRDRTDAIYTAMDKILNEDLFKQLNTVEDADTEIYKEYQKKLSEMREIADVRYLYTAKLNENGEYIYVIDGLPLDEHGVPYDKEDFRFPGELIEEDIIEDINDTYKTERATLPDRILDTEWGKIFLAYYPIHTGTSQDDDVIGVVGIELSAESQYDTYKKIRITTPIIITIFCFLAWLISFKLFKYLSNPSKRDLYNIDAMTNLKNRASFESDVKNIYSDFTKLCLVVSDLDDLKTVNDKQGHRVGDEYIRIAADVMSEIVSNSGVAYRVGGDEFVAVLDTTNEEKIKKEIAGANKKLSSKLTENRIIGSFSVGYAIFDALIDENLNDTLHRADMMMYDEKRTKKVNRKNES